MVRDGKLIIRKIVLRGSALRYVFICLAVAYLALTLLLPPDPETLQRYNLSVPALRALQVSVALPLVAIWAAAAYGYSRLRDYSDLVGSTAEGNAIRHIANGLMILAIGQPVQSIVSAVLDFASRRGGAVEAVSTIFTNYLNLMISLVAFVLITIGLRSLTDLKRLRTPTYAVHAHIIVYIMLAISYTYFVLHFAFLHGGFAESYRMPLWLVLLTLVLPYVYTWSIGLQAAHNMYLYNAALKGVLYKRSWMLLSFGLALIIASIIVIQYLTALSAQLNRLSITAILLVVYGLLVLMAAGYLLVAMGARRLQMIEEV